MKKILFTFLILASMIFTAVTCLADTSGNTLVGSNEIDEILPDMEILVEDARIRDIKQEEMDFDNAIRDYIDIDVLKKNIKSADEMRAYLKDARYIYLIPIHRENAEYELIVSKGTAIRADEDLTDDERAYLEKRTDRWSAPGIYVCESENDPEIPDNKKLMEVFYNCYGIENSETFFVGGITSESVITGVCFVDDPAYEEPFYVLLDKIEPDAKTAEDIKDAVFTYDEIIKYPPVNSSLATASGNVGVSNSSDAQYLLTVVLPVAGLVAVIAVVVVVYQKRKKKA